MNDGPGGVIRLNEKGNVALAMNCKRVFRGHIDTERHAKVEIYSDGKET